MELTNEPTIKIYERNYPTHRFRGTRLHRRLSFLLGVSSPFPAPSIISSLVTNRDELGQKESETQRGINPDGSWKNVSR